MLQLATRRPRWLTGGQRIQARMVLATQCRDPARRRDLQSRRSCWIPGAQARQHPAVDQARHVRRDDRKAPSTRVFVGAPYQQRRQDRHRAGRHDRARTTSTTPRRLAEYQRDHSLYTAFAPLDEPQRRAGGDRRRTPASAPRRRAPIARRVLDYVIAGPLPVAGGHRAGAEGPGRRAGRHLADGGRGAAAGHPDIQRRRRHRAPVAFAAASVPSAPAPGARPAAPRPRQRLRHRHRAARCWSAAGCHAARRRRRPRSPARTGEPMILNASFGAADPVAAGAAPGSAASTAAAVWPSCSWSPSA